MGHHMKMGYERNVLRWEIHQAILMQRLDALEREPYQSDEHVQEREQEIAALRRAQRALGPAPRGKMG